MRAASSNMHNLHGNPKFTSHLMVKALLAYSVVCCLHLYSIFIEGSGMSRKKNEKLTKLENLKFVSLFSCVNAVLYKCIVKIPKNFLQDHLKPKRSLLLVPARVLPRLVGKKKVLTKT